MRRVLLVVALLLPRQEPAPVTGETRAALERELDAWRAGTTAPTSEELERLQGEAETTGTLKYRKVDLVKEGFDPMNTGDPLFVIDAERKTYTPIDVEMFRRITGGSMRL